MKRCPQCEFIYEDEQSFCDMDGSKLAFDSRPLPNLQALTSVHVHSKKTNSRARVLPALASLILATVLSLVYYVSIHQHRQLPVQNNYTANAETQISDTVPTQPEVTNVAPLAPDTVSSAAQPSQPAVPEKDPPAVKDESKRTSASTDQKGKSNASRNVRDSRKAVSQNQTSQGPSKASSTDEKKESKVGTFLKKTGQLLKKPFKF